jgi:hypothetical protein
MINPISVIYDTIPKVLSSSGDNRGFDFILSIVSILREVYN